jgi:hypothetical protein
MSYEPMAGVSPREMELYWRPTAVFGPIGLVMGEGWLLKYEEHGYWLRAAHGRSLSLLTPPANLWLRPCENSGIRGPPRNRACL